MATADLAILARDFPVSHALLAHHDLMTPVLTRLFGDVRARQIKLEDHGDRLVRWSTLYQTATSAALLQARLEIFKPALPAGLLDRLLTGAGLFGRLVIEAGLAVQVADHHVFRIGPEDRPHAGADPGVHAGAWGRRHRMLRADNAAPLCDVEERLENEVTLQSLILPAQRDHPDRRP